ncbi:MAG: hypothetical protein A2Z52_00750 [Candidatus Moranbacteria bacterium RBG_19FT_COMBO_42_6]|nr:MAG: hypothetical protein A2Z52_00750 [Candidatus Moranbacteria bacterium RBG_19FT_COMBO_42_6]
MVRIQFHYKLFYLAMVSLLGREPDQSVRLGDNGFYDFYYLPRNEEEASSFHQHARTLAEWLDNFQILFSGSRCEYGRSLPAYPEKEVLQIKIQEET